MTEHLVLGGADLLATNSEQVPDRVVPRSSTGHRPDGDRLTVGLPPVSWSLIRTTGRPGPKAGA